MRIYLLLFVVKMIDYGYIATYQILFFRSQDLLSKENTEARLYSHELPL